MIVTDLVKLLQDFPSLTDLLQAEMCLSDSECSLFITRVNLERIETIQ